MRRLDNIIYSMMKYETEYRMPMLEVVEKPSKEQELIAS